uniref:Reverse transcriptase domain-containing protein n=1 Tax=Neogobius melanostomus TaxID=47308 RepID=A0A8C6TMS6_9GOBI
MLGRSQITLECDQCPLCKEYLYTLGHASVHFKRKHAKKVLLCCSQCTKPQPTVTLLPAHTKQGGLNRTVANEGTFRTKRGLSQHMREAHPTFRTKRGLSQHMGEAHPTFRTGPLPVTNIHKEDASSPRVLPSYPTFVHHSLGQSGGKTPHQRAWEWWVSKVGNKILMGEDLKCNIPISTIRAYYQSTWGAESRFKHLGQFGALPLASNDPFHYLIEGSEVVSALKKMKSDTSPGPDGIQRFHLRRLYPKGIELAALYNSWLVAGIIPNCLKRTITTLIPKSHEPGLRESAEDWGSLSLSSVVLRTFSSIMAQRLSEACPVHPRQRGFVAGPGCAENIALLHGLLQLAKNWYKDLAVVFVDLADAFNTVPHELLKESLRQRGIDRIVCNLIAHSYRGCTTSVKVGSGITSPIELKIQQGLQQGDPLSPVLFSLALDPLIYVLEKEGVGIEFGNDTGICCMVSADKLVILSGSWAGMNKNLAILDTFCDLVGLKANPQKCSGFLLSRVGPRYVVNNCSHWKIDGEPIEMLDRGHTIKYLGVNFDPWQGVIKAPILVTLKRMVDSISAAHLDPSQKLHILKKYVMPKITYSADHTYTHKVKLEMCDKRVRRAVKTWLNLSHNVAYGFLISRPKDGGLGITKLSTHIPALQLRRVIAMVNSCDPIINKVGRVFASNIPHLWKTATGMSLEGNADDVDLLEVSPKRIRKRETAKWMAKGRACFENDPISNTWLPQPYKVHMTELQFSMALQLRLLTFPLRTGMRSTPFSDTVCRLCGKVRETLQHIIGNCYHLRKMRNGNHNRIRDLLMTLAESYGWLVFREKVLRLESGAVGIPDLIVVKDQDAIIIDVTVCFEQKTATLAMKAQKKIYKYSPFIPTCLSLSPGIVNVSVWGFPVGARGKWFSQNSTLLKILGLPKREIKRTAATISRMALYGSIRTCQVFNRLTGQWQPQQRWQ